MTDNIHLIGCPKEADPRNETCDCTRLKIALAGKISGETAEQSAIRQCKFVMGFLDRAEVIRVLEVLRKGFGV